MSSIALMAAILLGCGIAAAQTPKRKVDLGGVTEQHVMVPMRDKVRLSMHSYIFRCGNGPWPVLYEQRYMSVQGVVPRERAARLASHGYVVAEENFRGTQLSEGVYVGYRALGWGEQKDGYDSVEWLLKQPWSNGKVGTFGSSQAGYVRRNFLVVTEPPVPGCQFITDGGLSLFHLGYRLGGTIRSKKRFIEQNLSDARDPRRRGNIFETQFRHQNYDEYWQQEDCTRHFGEMDVPAIIVASWYDFMSAGGVPAFIGRQYSGGPHARGQQKLVIGPWLHGGVKTSTKIGELEYGEKANWDLDAKMIRYFDYKLKGVETGVDKDPAVRYFVLGAVGEPGAPGNVWRDADDWPVKAQETAYYFQSAGTLSRQKPESASGATEFVSDPEHPAPMPGRNYPAARDGREFEKHPDVRTFTSELLTQPVEWTGKIRAELYISSSARDTDFIARISDVYPDGRSIMVLQTIRRARYRNSFEHPTLLTPGKIERVAFDLGWLSEIFNRGHRIRIAISGTGADFYEPNPNTGEAFTIEPAVHTVVAKDTVYHNRQYASRIIALVP